MEATEVAEWLNLIGVTAAVLEYCVPGHDPGRQHAAPLQDVQRALRHVRHRAEVWGVDPARVGVSVSPPAAILPSWPPRIGTRAPTRSRMRWTN
jgi:hypothetical protein